MAVDSNDVGLRPAYIQCKGSLRTGSQGHFTHPIERHLAKILLPILKNFVNYFSTIRGGRSLVEVFHGFPCSNFVDSLLRSA
jgi:hypothetical protein